MSLALKKVLVSTLLSSVGLVMMSSSAFGVRVDPGYKTSCAETEIIGNMKIFDTIAQGTTVKVMGYTSENRYIQPFEIYVIRAWDGQVAQRTHMAFPLMHEHSAAVAWSSDDYGNLSVRKTKYSTGRKIKITSLQVISDVRGGGVVARLSCLNPSPL